MTEDQEDVSFYRRFYVELDRGIRQEQRLQRQELAMYEDMLSGQEQTSDNKVLIQLEEKTERLYTRTASAGFQFWEVQPECHQRIPVPLLNQASCYHCEPIAIKYGKTFGVWPVHAFNTPAWTATVEPQTSTASVVLLEGPLSSPLVMCLHAGYSTLECKYL